MSDRPDNGKRTLVTIHVEIYFAFALFQSNPDSSWYDLVHSIEYLNCVISEAQRLSPPAYVADRECAEPCTINGVHFPKGVTVSFPIYGLHHDPTAWPDVDKFDPERLVFLNFLTKLSKISPGELLY